MKHTGPFYTRYARGNWSRRVVKYSKLKKSVTKDLYLTVWVQNGEGLWKKIPNLNGSLLMLLSWLPLSISILFSFVAISTSLENNNKIQMNWNLFSGDELLISVSCSLFFYPAWHLGNKRYLSVPVLCMRKAFFDLKTKAIVSFTTRTAANVHTECPTNLKHLCYPSPNTHTYT